MMRDSSKKSMTVNITGIQYWFVVLSLWYYTYLYYYPFNQGVSNAPVIFSYLKYIFWAFVLVFCIIGKRVNKLRGVLLYAIVFMAMLFLIQLIHIPQYAKFTDSSGLFIGNFFAFSPVLFFFTPDTSKRLFNNLPYIMVIQVAASFVLAELGHVLWDNNAYVGGVGTHVAFALLLNLGIVLIISKPDIGLFDYVVVGILFLGLFLSKSLSGLAIGVVSIGIVLFINGKRHVLGYLAFTMILLFGLKIAWENGLISNFVVLSMVEKLRQVTGDPSLFNSLGQSVPMTLSVSVSLRQEMYMDGWNFLTQSNGINLLIGNFENSVSEAFDSQYLTIFINYGFISLALLLFLLMKLFNNSLTILNKNKNLFPLLAIVIFAMSFIFSRHLYYYPNSIIFFLLIIHTASEYEDALSFNLASSKKSIAFKSDLVV